MVPNLCFSFIVVTGGSLYPLNMKKKLLRVKRVPKLNWVGNMKNYPLCEVYLIRETLYFCTTSLAHFFPPWKHEAFWNRAYIDTVRVCSDCVHPRLITPSRLFDLVVVDDDDKVFWFWKGTSFVSDITNEDTPVGVDLYSVGDEASITALSECCIQWRM